MTAQTRLPVAKTYKLYIGGKFPRTESGRSFEARSPNGRLLAHLCRASRKDLREAVVAARKAFPGWAERSGYNRGQILYRIAEMLEGRATQFAEELTAQGSTLAQAKKEVETTVDRLVHYAGWADKYAQLHSTVNPVASPHFNFSMPEPTGVVGILAPNEPSLLGLVTLLASALAGGNSVVAHLSETRPLAPATFAEVLNDSDVPPGVVNLLTGHRDELLPHLSSHMDVNALFVSGLTPEQHTLAEENAVHNLKRIATLSHKDLAAANPPGLQPILALQETKTIWHPIGA